MKNLLYEKALSCKRIIDKEIVVNKNVIRQPQVIFYDFDIVGNINILIQELWILHHLLQDKYPYFAMSIQEHIAKLRDKSVQIIHFTAIDTIIDCVLSLEKQRFANNKKVFISHSSKDKAIVTSFVDHILCLGIGIDSDEIFCTSIEDMTMNNGDDIRQHIKQHIQSSDFSLLMISDNYKNSEVCQNELGAVWAIDNNVKYFLLPNMPTEKIGWLWSPNKAEEISNAVYLDKFQKDLMTFYHLEEKQSWSRQRQSFIDSINN